MKITLASGITVNRLTSVADLAFLTRGGNRQTRGALPSRPLPSPLHLSFPPLPLEVGSLNPARGPGGAL